MDERNERIGYRVASLRKLAGMTQERLACTAHVSRSLVRAVEQGRMPASAAFTAAVARALGLDVTTRAPRYLRWSKVKSDRSCTYHLRESG